MPSPLVAVDKWVSLESSQAAVQLAILFEYAFGRNFKVLVAFRKKVGDSGPSEFLRRYLKALGFLA